ncbi:hypothetical protein IV73_GL001064 [Weissella kandleri]|uniref:Uncharacterized protein n=1 Tax=Weissella kandleri TaxID=1616 RepID=A0A0R2JBW5_9LACO|nr:DUF3991 domain-containing protein [Weissella kandleri]KRN74787.1 hypothetical protein IV73_GL001064 [Weissella kandleri]
MARLSKEEWEKLKELPIIGYLDYKGIDHIEETKNYHRSVEHDSLVFNLKKNTYSWNSRKTRNGDLGNFIEEYEGVTKSEALARWLEYAKYSSGLDFDIKKRYAVAPDKYKFNWEKIKKSDNFEAAKTYLVNERNLSEGFVDRLFKSGTIYSGYKFKDRNSGAILNAPIYFPWKDENGKVVGADRQGTTINFEKFSKRGTEKKISRGSNTEYGFNLSFGTGADKLIVFESPIDALSYIQQNLKDLVNDNSTIFATSGGDYSKVGFQLQRMTDNNGKVPDALVLATDNDLAGFNLANHFDFEFASREIPVMGKDWNDQLKANVTGIKKMTMDESVQHAKSLNDLKKAENVEVPDGVLKDDNQVIKSVSRPKTYQSRKERALATRKVNEQIIKDAMNNVKTIQKDPKQVKKYLDFVANNSEFSTRNSLLMFSQYPNAEMMKGNREFKDMGFYIQKGEKGSRILGAPQKASFLVMEDGSRVKQSDASTNQLRLASEGKLKVSEFKYYPIVSVFDVKQTTADSKHISRLLNNRKTSPKLSDLTESQANAAYDILANQANQMGIKLNVENNASMFKQRDSKVNGVFATKKNDPLDQTIFIREGLSPYDKVSALATELGQASLHNTVRGNEVEQNLQITNKYAANIENQATQTNSAESLKTMQSKMASYIVLKHIGIEPDVPIEDDLKNWSDVMGNVNDSKGKVLAQVTQASKVVTRNLDEKLSNYMDEKPVIKQLSNTKQSIERQNNQVLMDESNSSRSATVRR